MDLRQIFGKNLKSFRFQNGLTQEKLAELVDISINYVSQLEAGLHSADFDVIERLSKCLNIEPYQLFLEPKNEILPKRVDMKKKV